MVQNCRPELSVFSWRLLVSIMQIGNAQSKAVNIKYYLCSSKQKLSVIFQVSRQDL